ncbi:MAG: hypothetical protein B6242_05215 [Anaerolineaceae bacterium 4572_78]|nr:MAG: hypothetical protein B6242_05215 [Anaerolineaceae bacterium 4572_78]
MDKKLQQAIKFVKSGKYKPAEKLLREVTADQPKNEMAWMWLSGIVSGNREKQTILQKVLVINPDNEMARKGFIRFGGNPTTLEAITSALKVTPTKIEPEPEPMLEPEIDDSFETGTSDTNYMDEIDWEADTFGDMDDAISDGAMIMPSQSSDTYANEIDFLHDSDDFSGKGDDIDIELFSGTKSPSRADDFFAELGLKQKDSFTSKLSLPADEDDFLEGFELDDDFPMSEKDVSHTVHDTDNLFDDWGMDAEFDLDKKPTGPSSQVTGQSIEDIAPTVDDRPPYIMAFGVSPTYPYKTNQTYSLSFGVSPALTPINDGPTFAFAFEQPSFENDFASEDDLSLDDVPTLDIDAEPIIEEYPAMDKPSPVKKRKLKRKRKKRRKKQKPQVDVSELEEKSLDEMTADELVAYYALRKQQGSNTMALTILGIITVVLLGGLIGSYVTYSRWYYISPDSAPLQTGQMSPSFNFLTRQSSINFQGYPARRAFIEWREDKNSSECDDQTSLIVEFKPDGPSKQYNLRGIDKRKKNEKLSGGNIDKVIVRAFCASNVTINLIK